MFQYAAYGFQTNAVEVNLTEWEETEIVHIVVRGKLYIVRQLGAEYGIECVHGEATKGVAVGA